jgi:hypothetical protein
MSRIDELMAQQPRIWPLVADSETQWLEHTVFIQREVRASGNTDGTPNYTLATWGPYQGRLSTPEGAKTQQPDRWTDSTTRHLAVRSDVRPLEQDYVLVFAPFLPLTPPGTIRAWLTNFLDLPSADEAPPTTPLAAGNVNAARFRVTATTEPRNAHWLAEGEMVLWSVELQYTQEM